MGLITRVVVGLVVLYIAVFTLKLGSLLFPSTFIKVSRLVNAASADDAILLAAWNRGTEVLVDIELLTKHRVHPIPTKPRLIFNDDMNNTIRFELNMNDLSSFVAPGSIVRFKFRPTVAVPVTTEVVGDVPLMMFRPPPTEKKMRPKYNLVERIPVLCDLFPRPNSTTTVNHRVEKPAFVTTREPKRIGYLLPRIAIHLVADWTAWPRGSVPEHVGHHLRVHQSSDASSGWSYTPLISTIQMGIKHHELIQINQTDNMFPPVVVEIGTMGLSRWAFYSLMEESFKLHRSMGLIEESDMDDIRTLLTESSPELLMMTIVVSLIHLLFDALAFKSDIAFWRKINSSQGLSSRSALLSLLAQLVITAYLLDQDASMLVLVPAYIGLVIALWKVLKLISLQKSPKASSNLARQELNFDAVEAMSLKYMGLILSPLVCGYAFLTLVRDDHRSWYSWGLSSLASCVYAGGFALMTPQIFLNYKLKSVVHLDWSALWYRAFNTFIDDFFAYLIPMPGLARMAVLRDDLVFVIFLYQRWLYPARQSSDVENMEEKKVKNE